MNQLIIQLGDAVALDGVPFTQMKPRVAGSKAIPFGCTIGDAAFAALNGAAADDEPIKLAGNRLFAALTAHPDINQRLQAAMLTDKGSRYPVFIEIDSTAGVEALPWEALCSPTDLYFGLDDRWALARIVEPPTPPSPLPHRLTPPIRIAAVLSCLNISALGELAALRQAIRSTGADHAQLLVIVSEETLFRDLKARQAEGTAPEIARVEFVPPNLDTLQSTIRAFAPHVVHFFCHGSAQNSPHIELARKSDWQDPEPKPLIAEALDFHGFTEPTDALPWLVVLNCCEGAGVTDASDSQSLALRLVQAGVAPAVLGMREPVVSSTANQLTEALYSKLLTKLAERIQTGDQSPTPLDWPHLVVAARDRLARSNGTPLSQARARAKDWLLPIVYLYSGDFNLQVLPPPPGPPPATDAPRVARLEIDALQALLLSLPPDQAPDLRADAVARIRQLAATLGTEMPA
jgi:hypothetical protein